MDNVVLPDVFPSVNELRDHVQEAFSNRLRTSVRDLSYSPIEQLMPDKEDLFINSVLHHPVALNNFDLLIDPNKALVQIIGIFLNDGSLLNRMIGEPGNSIVNADSMRYARIVVDNINSADTINLEYRCKYKPSLERYLSSSDGASVEVEDETAIVRWSISLGSETQDPIAIFYDSIVPALIIYHKLLTRFSLCQTYQNSLPDFENS